jgi:hypothetical protein
MNDRPRVKRSPIDGAILTREVRPFTVAFKGRETVVDLPGWYPNGKGEAVNDADDLGVVDNALDRIEQELSQQVETAQTPTPASKRTRGQQSSETHARKRHWERTAAPVTGIERSGVRRLVRISPSFEKKSG